jgi:hypothetical protein
MPPKKAATKADVEEVEVTEEETPETPKADDGRHSITVDQFIGEVIQKCWLQTFEVRNLDYETFTAGEQPQQVFISVEVQDTRSESGYEAHEFDGSGAYIGEALAMVLEQIRLQFG